MERKLNEIPNRGLYLFMKLYCERKGVKNKETVTEAKDIWLSLNRSDKRQFLKTSNKRRLLKYAHSLSSTELYVKKKCNARNKAEIAEGLDNEVLSLTSEQTLNKSDVTENISRQSLGDIIAEGLTDGKSQNECNLEVINETQSNHVIQEHTEGNSVTFNDIKKESNIEARNETQEDNDYNQVNHNIGSPITCNEINEASMDTPDTQSDCNSNPSTAAMSFPEPTPPTVKNGKEMYHMIKQPCDTNWSDMPAKEKNYYNSAVRLLKRNYIKNYTLYLESLTQQQLFDHYMKTIRT